MQICGKSYLVNQQNMQLCSNTAKTHTHTDTTLFYITIETNMLYLNKIARPLSLTLTQILTLSVTLSYGHLRVCGTPHSNMLKIRHIR